MSRHNSRPVIHSDYPTRAKPGTRGGGPARSDDDTTIALVLKDPEDR
jgi:hypothetical protein